MKIILVTGAAGFIGSHLVEKLLANGSHVFAVDNFDPFYDKHIKETNIRDFRMHENFRLFETDLLDKTALRKVFKEDSIDVVVHLAAKAGIRPSLLDPTGYFNTNVIGTLNLLETMKENECKKLIFASSSSIYGNNKKVPFSENDSVDSPISPYAASKKAGELICHTYHHLFGFDIFCLRFFTVYGPRQRPDLAIHKFAKLINEGSPIPFYGNGSTERDYTYIDDIVNGITGALDNLHGYEIINLGESRTVSLIQMVSTLEKALGRKAILNKLPLQPGDVERTFADITKAKRKLGYNPQYSFEAGIAKFCEWLLPL